MATEDEKVRERANRARVRGQIAGKPKISLKDVRQTTGNKPQADSRKAFKDARRKVRGFARGAGRLGGAATVEVAGVGGEAAGGFAEGLGLKDKADAAKKAGKKGTQKLGESLKEAGEAAKKIPGAAKGLAKRTAIGTAKFGLRTLPGVGAGFLAAEAFKPTDQLVAQGGFAPEVKAESEDEKFLGFSKGGLQAAGSAALGTIRGALGFPAEGSEVEQTPQDPGLRFPVPPAGAPPVAAPPAGASPVAAPPAGAPPAGAPPAGIRGAFTTGSGAEVPAPGQGFFVNPQEQRTNLGTGAGAGLRQAATTAQPEQLEGTNRRTLDALSEGVNRGGVASAFGALATGGNVLRQEAAERQQQRQLQQQTQRQGALLDVAVVNAKADIADLPLKQQEQFNKVIDSINTGIREATEANDQKALNRERSRAFQGAIRNDQGPERVIANAIVANDLEEVFGASLLADIGISSGRGFLDLLQNLGNQPTVPLNPSGQTFLDRETGNIMRLNAQGGAPQILAGFNQLPDDTQDFFKQSGVLTSIRDKKGLRTLQAGGPATAGVLR